MTIGVVVSALGMAELIAPVEHWHALREKKGGNEIKLLAGAEKRHCRVIRRSLHPAIPAVVFVRSVLVVLAVRFVVFIVVAHQVFKRETVVARHEINTGVRPPTALFIEVAAAAQCVANSETTPPSPFQNRRTVSRYLPFHSVQRTGKLPTW